MKDKILREKYMTKVKRKELRKELKNWTIGDLKEVVINLIPLEKATFKYIIERDNNNCRFCGSKIGLEVTSYYPKRSRRNKSRI